MPEKKVLVIGGDMEKAVQGNYQISIKGLFDEAWQLTQKTKWVLVQSMMLVLGMFFVVALIIGNTMETKGIDIMALEGVPRLLLDMGVTLLFAPLMAGLLMMGVNHSAGAVSKPQHLFHFLPKTLAVTLVALLTSIMVQLGLMLYIVPGIYLMVATSFALPLLLEKGMPPMQAVMVSIRVVTHQWWRFLAIYAIFMLMFMAVMLTFGVALIWVGPLYYNAMGILYRDLFGVRITVAMDANTNEQSYDSIFKA